MSCTNNTNTIALDVTGGVLTADAIIDPDPSNALSSSVDGMFVIAQNQTGWFSADETWVYAGADAPSFSVGVIGDKTSKYSPGMRVRLKQGGGYLYFIMTVVAYDSGSGLTIITMYGGTPYVLANSTITDNWFSWAQTPAGFPADPLLWTQELSDGGDRSQASPAAGTWYNPGALSLTIPVGSWDVYYEVTSRVQFTANNANQLQVSLSTASNGESDTSMTAGGEVNTSDATTQKLAVPVYRRKTLTLTAKTTYYLVVKTTQTVASSITLAGSLYGPSIVRARCNYL